MRFYFVFQIFVLTRTSSYTSYFSDV